MPAVVPSDQTAAARQVFEALYRESYETAVVPSQPMVLEDPTPNAQTANYDWVGAVPTIKEYLSRRQIESLRKFGFSITDRKWESSIKVDLDAFLYDRLGIFRPRIQEMALAARYHQVELVTDLIEAGETDLAYDGVAFFADTHAEGDSGSNDNLYTGTGSTVAQIKADFIGAKAAMLRFKNDRGLPYIRREPRFLIVAPPELEGNLREFLNAQVISQTTNVWAGAADLWINSLLADTNDWYLFNVAAPVKPFILKVTQQPTFGSDESEATQYHEDAVYFGTKGIYNAGYGLYQYAIKVKNS